MIFAFLERSTSSQVNRNLTGGFSPVKYHRRSYSCCILIFWTIFTTKVIMLFFLELIRMKIMTRRNSESDFVCWSEWCCIYSLTYDWSCSCWWCLGVASHGSPGSWCLHRRRRHHEDPSRQHRLCQSVFCSTAPDL